MNFFVHLKKLLGAFFLIQFCSAPVDASPEARSYRALPLQNFQSGQIGNLADLDINKPVYIKMWATWCQPCLQQMPHFQKLYKQFGDRVNFVAVNIDINESPDDISQVVNKFNLTMPVWRDLEGKLAVHLGLIGTPFSVLLNSSGEQVYSTHESDQVLDGFLTRLAQGQQLPPSSTELLSSAAQQQRLKPFLTGEHFLFFTATWCDWYLKESRPAMSAQCQQAQRQLNDLTARFPNTRWTGIVNHLWTDDKALTEFNTLYKMNIPFQIDHQGVLFQHFNIRQIPVLLKISNGKVIKEINVFENLDEIYTQFK